MTSSALAAALRQLADYAEIRGDAGDSSAWRRLAADVEHAGEAGLSRLKALAADDRLSEIPALHPTHHWSLRELLFGDPDSVLEKPRQALPWLIRVLLELRAVDSAGAARLARHGIVTLPDLEAALDDGRIASHMADAADSLQFARDALAFERPRVPLGRALEIADTFVQIVAAACPDAKHLAVAGDVRRFEPLVDWFAVVASAANPPAVIDAVTTLPLLGAASHVTARRALVGFRNVEVDFRVAAPDEYGTALVMATGSHAHLAAFRARHRAVRLCAREEEVYAQAGLSWIPPEIRHASGEIEAAAGGRLPALVAREHIRGDLHLHSTYSDGRDSLADMVARCAELGYEYIAVTDHSERAGASRTVTRQALARQRDEIARLQTRYPSMTILHGIEVDIMPDGSLDFPDEVLESLDIVLASLHNPAGHAPARLTRRCLAAIQHPLVNIITHPANQLVGRDQGYALDFPAVYAAAAESGTALEIDGAPSHLDLDGDRARAAVAAGVTVTIDSDCHRARLLDRQMAMGIGTARRGWVEPGHVLNTRPIEAVREFIAAKRARRG